MEEKFRESKLRERRLIFFRYRKLFIFLLICGWSSLPFIFAFKPYIFISLIYYLWGIIVFGELLILYTIIALIFANITLTLVYFYFKGKSIEQENWSLIYSCAPEDGIKEANKVINARFATKTDKYEFYMYKARCLHAAGRFDEAQKELKKIDIEHIKKYIDCGDILYLQYSATFHIANKELNDAVNNLEKMKELARKYEHTKYERKTKNYILLIEKRIAFEKKEFDECINFYYSFCANKKATMYHKVDFAYALGVILIEKNEIDKAKDCLTFAASNGNTLYNAKQARELLATIDKITN